MDSLSNNVKVSKAHGVKMLVELNFILARFEDQVPAL